MGLMAISLLSLKSEVGEIDGVPVLKPRGLDALPRAGGTVHHHGHIDWYDAGRTYRLHRLAS